MEKTWRGRPTPETIAAQQAKRFERIASAVATAAVRPVRRKRKETPRPTGVSILTQGVEHRDVKMDAMALNFTTGSRALCRAVLSTGRLYGPMSEAAQLECVRYAHNIK